MLGQIIVTAVTVATTIALSMAGVPAPVAAAIGSINGQLHGMVLGVQDSINWKSVGIAAISAGLSGGVDPASTFRDIAIQAAKGAAANAATQGVANAVGLQDGFSWTAVAAAGVSAGVSAGVGGMLDTQPMTAEGGLSASNIAGHAARATASAVANAATRSALDGSSFGDNLVAAIPDVVGQTLGSVMGAGMAGEDAHEGAFDPFGLNGDSGFARAVQAVGRVSTAPGRWLGGGVERVAGEALDGLSASYRAIERAVGRPQEMAVTVDADVPTFWQRQVIKIIAHHKAAQNEKEDKASELQRELAEKTERSLLVVTLKLMMDLIKKLPSLSEEEC